MKKIFLDEKSKKDIKNNLIKRNPASYSEYESVVREIVENEK